MASTLTFGPNIVTNGLVVYYDISNPASYPGSGNTVYNLIPSYSNITARLSGSGGSIPTFNSNGIKSYLNFDSSSQHWMYYDMPTMNPSFTAMVVAASPYSYGWVSLNNGSNIVEAYSPATPLSGFRIYVSPSDTAGGITYNIPYNTYYNLPTLIPSPINAPHYYYIGLDNSSANYIEGIDNTVTTGTATTTNRGIATNVRTTFSRFSEPYFSDFGGRWLNMNFYYYMLYNRRLSNNEIAQNYSALKFRFNLS